MKIWKDVIGQVLNILQTSTDMDEWQIIGNVSTPRMGET